MKQVFISYASADRSYALKVHQTLSTWGLIPWLDVQEIKPGEEWWKSIDQGLRQAHVAVGLLSPSALQSENVQKEWHWMLLNGRKLVPLLIQKVNQELISHRFVGIQWLPFDQEEDNGFPRLREALAITDAAIAEPKVSNPAPPASLRLDQTSAKPTRASKRDLLNRTRMLERVEAFWIEGVLKRTLSSQANFTVEYQMAPDAVVRNVDFSDCQIPQGYDLYELFCHIGRRILILGAPGSGKTITLLRLAESLLARATHDLTEPIPVVLNLSSWPKKQQPIAQWVRQELALTYQIPQKLAKRWLDNEAITLLLDGLDEVRDESREACLHSINEFRADYPGIGLTVCSRIAEYQNLTERLDVKTGVILQPLEEDNINDMRNRVDLGCLDTLLHREPWVAEMLRNPLLSQFIRFAYSGASSASVLLPVATENLAARQIHLMEAYVERRLADSRFGEINKREFRTFLHWLAEKMVADSQTVFHIEDLQDHHLPSFFLRLFYRIAWRLLFSAFLVLSTLACCALVWQFKPNDYTIDLLKTTINAVWSAVAVITSSAATSAALAFAKHRQENSKKPFWPDFGALALVTLISAACAGIGVWIANGSEWKIPTTIKEFFEFCFYLLVISSSLAWLFNRLAPARTGWYSAVCFLLLGTLLDLRSNGWPAEWSVTRLNAPLGMALVGAWVSLQADKISMVERLSWRWNLRGAILSIVIFLPFALLLGTNVVWYGVLQFFLLSGALSGLRRSEKIRARIKPGAGVINSLKNATLFGLGLSLFAIGATFAGVFYYVHPFPAPSYYAAGMTYLTCVFFLTGLIAGGIDVPIKHFVLRLLLLATKRTPWKLTSYLNFGVENSLLRRVGGAYIFVHRMLLEHLARQRPNQFAA